MAFCSITIYEVCINQNVPVILIMKRQVTLDGFNFVRIKQKFDLISTSYNSLYIGNGSLLTSYFSYWYYYDVWVLYYVLIIMTWLAMTSMPGYV